MNCFECPNQWNCKKFDDVLQGRTTCSSEKRNPDPVISARLRKNGGYMYKAIADTLKDIR